MDPVQILLFVVVLTLTGLLVAVGVQAFLILHSAKKTIKKLNELLDDVQVLTNSVARPVQGITHLIEGVKNLRSIVDFTSGLVNKKPQEEVDTSPVEGGFYNYESLAMEEEEPYYKERAAILLKEEKPHPIHKIQERGRRFFHRSGKPLTS